MSGAAITGWGTALPAATLDNAELAARLDVSEEWIFSRTGIRSRRIASAGETSSSLATTAGAMAIARAGITGGEIDLVIVATVTPDHPIPAIASLVQANLGCSRAGAFDLNAGCAGFLYALAQAQAAIAGGSARRVLVCGADVLSRVTDYSDLGSSILFGDGAGAVVVEATESRADLGPFFLRSDGSASQLLWIPPGTETIQMRGREVYRHAVEGMSDALREVLHRASVGIGDLDLVVVHQANGRIIEAVVDRLGIDPDVVHLNIELVGNTSSASIPLALSDAVEHGKLYPGARVALAAFGAGFAWGAGLMTWGVTRPAEPAARRLPALVGTTGHLLEAV